jgi:CTP:molybdopterin cytidylyltransferase MocA
MRDVTVAAVILFAQPEGAFADAAGRPAARRAVESAWAGGATPIVVVAADPSGQLALSLAGSPAVLAEPAPAEGGPVGQMVHGIRVCADKVTDTDAVLLWPGRMTWVDAETVTTLIESHGVRRDALLRPRYDEHAGWPVLLPMASVDALNSMSAELMPDALFERLAGEVESALVDTGDPGTVFDRSTAFDELPPYAGPPEPAQPSPEWGAAAAETPDDVPLEGPALAPYGQAAEEAE